MTTATATGTLMRKATCQLKNSKSVPPTSGPIMAPTSANMDHTASARVRSMGSVKMLRTMDSVVGMMSAPATPSIARNPITMAELVANSTSSDTRPNSVKPMRSALRRPIRSATALMGMSRPARIRGYMSTIHSCSVVVERSSAVSCGRAINRMVMSMVIITSPAESSARAAQRCRLVMTLAVFSVAGMLVFLMVCQRHEQFKHVG